MSSDRERDRQARRAHVRAFLGAVTLAAAATVVAGVLRSTGARLEPLALFVAAGIASEIFYVQPSTRSGDPTRRHQTIGFSAGVHLAAAIVLGPWQAPLVAYVSTLFSRPLRNASWRITRFNAAMVTIAVFAAGLAFEACGGVPGRLSLPGDWPALLALFCSFYLVNDGLLATVLRLTSGGRVLSVFRDVVARGAAGYPGECGVVVVLAALALANPWATLALVPLVVAMYQAYARLAALHAETARALETFANIVDERDGSTYRHSERVAGLVRDFARGVGLPAAAVDRLTWTARLHDLGKIAVDASVLRKPGRLDEEEWAAMRRHPRLSARILRRFRFAAAEARAVEYHHERFDGRGYFGVDAGALPLASHLLVVADSYDAMTSDRPYRRGLRVEAALAEIEANLGKQFHPAVGKAFVALVRGGDPLAGLTVAERAELRALARLDRRRRAARATVLRRALPETLLVGGAVAALSAGPFGGPFAALPGAALAATGFAARWRERRRVLALRAELAAATTLEQVAQAIHGDERLAWAGLVRRNEASPANAIALTWSGSQEAPDGAALVSWLLRESDAESALVRTDEDELGRGRFYVAAPLDAAFLVLGFTGEPGRAVETALADALDELERSLALPAPRTRLAA